MIHIVSVKSLELELFQSVYMFIFMLPARLKSVEYENFLSRARNISTKLV